MLPNTSFDDASETEEFLPCKEKTQPKRSQRTLWLVSIANVVLFLFSIVLVSSLLIDQRKLQGNVDNALLKHVDAFCEYFQRSSQESH